MGRTRLRPLRGGALPLESVPVQPSPCSPNTARCRCGGMLLKDGRPWACARGCMRLTQLGGCDAAARSQGTDRCCADRRACALRFDNRCLPPKHAHMGRVWTGALSGESLLDKRQPRGPICQQAVIPAAPASSTPQYRLPLRADPHASTRSGCARHRGARGRAFSWLRGPSRADAGRRSATLPNGGLCARGTRVAFVGMASKRSAWSGWACTLGSSAGSSAMPSSIGSCVPWRLRRQRLRGCPRRANWFAQSSVRVLVSEHGEEGGVRVCVLQCACVCAHVCACACVRACVCAMDGRGLGGAGLLTLPCDLGAVLCSRSRHASPAGSCACTAASAPGLSTSTRSARCRGAPPPPAARGAVVFA